MFKPISMFIMISILCSMTITTNHSSSKAAETTGTISVVSFDGLGYEDAQRYIGKGIMPNLEKFQQQAAYATDFVTITPSLTAPSHAAMSTGAGPSKTGIVSNHFHSLGEKVKDDQSGFAQTLGATPIWKEARNQGKITATVSFPDSNPDNASAATYAVYSGGTLADSKLHNLKFSVVDDERVEQINAGSVKVEEAVISLDIKKSPAKQLYILRTDEKEPKYYISMDRKDMGEEVSPNNWIAVVLNLHNFDSAGFYVKLKRSPENNEELQLFQGTVMGGLYRGPGKFAEEIQSKFGFYPAADEIEAFKNGDITREEYEQVGERFTNWVTDVSFYIKESYRPDLLFYYYSVVDNELHEFLLREPAQPGYQLANVLEKEEYVSWAFGQADRAIGRIKNNQNPEDHVLIVSDHGLEPIHTRLSPNKELEKAGLLVKDQEGNIDASKTKAYAEASGTIAHVYVNLKGREKKGIVKEEEYEQVKKEIVSIFKDKTVFTALSQNPEKVAHPILRWLTSKNEKFNKVYMYPSLSVLSSEKQSEVYPYETIWTEDQEGYAALNNNNSGDVFLSAAPGFIMGKDAKIAVEPTQELGSHGGNPERSTLRPILYGSGPMIPPGEMSKRITMTDIAPSVYELLGLRVPDFVEGKIIWSGR
ncbi:alkaline phosphatase family protein [Sporosarcina ureae]|uniref:alkaline phosphatase family protein n=1 Tax=Sporosarcina ureae TaxID=1571 RepID=UPI0028B1848A|nr:alkaline phosphatase family protein [Sporosarcina ureae]